MKPIVLAITGASGVVYARRLLQALLESHRQVHLVISASGSAVLKQELDVSVDLNCFDPRLLLENVPVNANQLVYHLNHDKLASIASGSYLTDGMVICPCSGGTLGAVVGGISSNLIQRAAAVHLKERRKLILVPRETPLSLIQIENMKRAHEAGAIVLPAMPGWYHGVSSLEDLIDFVAARILDQLEVEHSITKRWGND